MYTRQQDAQFIQAGACNPTGVAHSFIRHAKDMMDNGADTNAIRQDPALRLIVHQLAFLMNTPAIDNDISEYSKLVDAIANDMFKAINQTLDNPINPNQQ